MPGNSDKDCAYLLAWKVKREENVRTVKQSSMNSHKL